MQNKSLNQMTANIFNVEVIAGPVETTALRNIMVQAIAKGQIESIGEAREIIKKSSNPVVLKPNGKKQ